MRIGIVSDTHVGEVLPELPTAVPVAFAGCDLILHAGDITCTSVLDRLGEIAPVVAVQGDHDLAVGIDLPHDRIINVRGRRIGLTHGHRARAVELPAAGLSLVRRRTTLLGLHRHLRRRFGPVDLIVHGHLYVPVDTEVRGTRVFSPGAVYVPEDRDLGDGMGVRRRVLMRFRGSLDPDARAASVGIVEVGPDGLTTHRIILHDVPG